ERWKHMDYRLDARKILLDASRLLVVDLNGQKVLLPGEQGFQKERGLELNLAYWVFPALETFAQIDPKGPWQKLIRSGLYLAETLALGPYRLPPDWVLWRTEEDPDVAPGRPARFGYEVIRAPLYLAWSEQRQSTLATRFLAYWNGYDTGKVPAWISLVTDDKANYPAPAGFDAVYQLVSFDAQKQSGKDSELAPPSLTLNTPVANQDYYSASLSLLAKLAMNERFNP
ncbi:MAG: glycosyl hydrolase family 8, partial [Oceanobacter sp.]